MSETYDQLNIKIYHNNYQLYLQKTSQRHLLYTSITTMMITDDADFGQKNDPH